MKYNYPLIIFGFVSIALIAMRYSQAPIPSRPAPMINVATTAQSAPFIAPVTSEKNKQSPLARDLSDHLGVTWHIKASVPLERKLSLCNLIELTETAKPVTQLRYWHRNTGGIVQVLTPRQASLSKTIKAHLATAACLYHKEISAFDPLTQRQFDGTNFPRHSSEDEFALDLFFKVIADDKTARSVGMTRLGHPELELQTAIANPQDILWRIIAMSLTDRPLDDLLKLDKLLLTLLTEDPTRAVISATKKVETNSIRKPSSRSKVPVRKLRTRLRTAPTHPTKPLSHPATMPEYR